MADNGFLMPIDRVTNDIVPRRIPLTEIEKVSKIDMAKLTNLYRGTDSEFPRNELYWTVNYDRFLIEIRWDFILFVHWRLQTLDLGAHYLKLIRDCEKFYINF